MHSLFSWVDFTLKCILLRFSLLSSYSLLSLLSQRCAWYSSILIETICAFAKSWADKQSRLFYADLLINFIRFDPYFIILNRFLIEKNFNFGFFFMIFNTTTSKKKREKKRRRRLKKANDYTVNERAVFFFYRWASSNLKRPNDFNNLICWKHLRCWDVENILCAEYECVCAQRFKH